MQKIEVKLNRDLGFFDITMIGIAGMIGAGVFALTGIAAGVAGPALIFAFLFNGIIATITALAYAELGSAIPQAGGGYVWIKEAFPKSAGFIAGWIDWFAHSVACSLYAVTFGAFIAVIFEGYLPFIIVSKLSTFLAITIFTYINYIGVKESGKVGGAITLMKVLILMIFGLFGLYRTFSNPDWFMNFTTPSFIPNGFAGLLAAMGLTYIAFEGYEIIVQSGEEAKNPDKNIPKAILISLWTATAIYILVAVSILGGIRSDKPSWMVLGDLGELGLIKTAGEIMPFGFIILLFAGLVSTTSAMNATIYSSSRVAFAMARDALLPRRLSTIHMKTRTPHYSIFFTYIIVSLMALSLPIEAIAASANIMFILLFIMVNLALIFMRLRAPNIKRPFKVPLMPYLPLAAIIMQFIISYFMIVELEHGFLALQASIGWIIAGVIVYSLYSKEEVTKAEKEEFKTIFEERPLEEGQYRILVAYANPEIGKRLVELADLIAKAREGEIRVLSVIKMPGQTPLRAGVGFLREHSKVLEELLKIPVSPAGGVIKMAHNISDAILNEVEDYRADLLIVGWRGRTFRRDFVFGSTIDPILLKADCDVIVGRFEPGFSIRKAEKILIPTAGGPHARLAVLFAKDLWRILKAKITLTYIARDKKSFDAGKEILESCAEECEIEAEKILQRSDKAIDTLAKMSKDYDVVFIGATAEPFFKNFIKGMFVEEFAKRTDRTILMVRKRIEARDLMKRLRRRLRI
jgi:amino acid transporter